VLEARRVFGHRRQRECALDGDDGQRHKRPAEPAAGVGRLALKTSVQRELGGEGVDLGLDGFHLGVERGHLGLVLLVLVG